MPEEEKAFTFTPVTQPKFTTEGRGKYYFDMKNNPEHYQMLTSDITEEQRAVYEDREKLRADKLHHTRQLIQRLVQKKIDSDYQKRAERLASRRKTINIDTLGEYKSVLFKHEQEDLFDDDDELIELSNGMKTSLIEIMIMMDTSERQLTEQAIQEHISKLTNKKSMLCPQKILRMNEFARDILNGIIWDDIRSRKVHPNALFKMGAQQKLGVGITKQVIEEKHLQ